MAKSETGKDAATFESLLTPILGSAYGMALKLTGEQADAEDLVQEAALLAYRGFHTFELGTNFKAWFYRILTNAYFGSRRKQKRRPIPVAVEDVPDFHMYERSVAAGLTKVSENPANLVLSRLDVDEVTEAIDSLPDEYRVVALLYFLEEMSYQEIADVVEVPVGTVRSRLHRGRKILQKMLWHVAEESGIISKLQDEVERE